MGVKRQKRDSGLVTKYYAVEWSPELTHKSICARIERIESAHRKSPHHIVQLSSEVRSVKYSWEYEPRERESIYASRYH